MNMTKKCPFNIGENWSEETDETEKKIQVLYGNENALSREYT